MECKINGNHILFEPTYIQALNSLSTHPFIHNKVPKEPGYGYTEYVCLLDMVVISNIFKISFEMKIQLDNGSTILFSN